MSESKSRVQPDPAFPRPYSACPVTPDDFASAAAELRACLAPYSLPKAVDDFVELVERLPTSLKGHAGEWDLRAEALASVVGAMNVYQIACTGMDSGRAIENDLRNLATQPTRKALERILGRCDRRPDLLTLMWQGAIACGRVKSPPNGERGIDVKIDDGWMRIIGGEDAWLQTLAADPSGLRYAACEAVRLCQAECPSRDFLRQFRDLKKYPTKRRLLNLLERDKDENDLRPAESAIRFAILRLGIFGNDVPLDWIARLGDSPELLRKIAETVCENFAYKVDGRGRLRDMPLEAYAKRLAQTYEDVTGRQITYAKATYSSPGRRAGEPYGPGLDFMLAGLRLIDPSRTPYQVVAQIERLRTARLGVAS